MISGIVLRGSRATPQDCAIIAAYRPEHHRVRSRSPLFGFPRLSCRLCASYRRAGIGPLNHYLRISYGGGRGTGIQYSPHFPGAILELQGLSRVCSTRCKRTWATRTFSTPSGTQSCRRHGSKIFGDKARDQQTYLQPPMQVNYLAVRKSPNRCGPLMFSDCWRVFVAVM